MATNYLYYGNGVCTLEASNVRAILIKYGGNIQNQDKTSDSFILRHKNNKIMIVPIGSGYLTELFEYSGNFEIYNKHIIYSDNEVNYTSNPQLNEILNQTVGFNNNGVADLEDTNDVKLLEDIFFKLTKEKFILSEADMVGSATGFSGTLGTWEKYIENAWNGHEVGVTLYKSLKSQNLFKGPKENIESVDVKINVGDEFTIDSNDKADLAKKGNSYYAPITYKGDQYFIPLNAILKPTGKNVEKFDPDLKGVKNDPSVYHPFVPGHPQESLIANLFIEQTSPNWEFD